MGMASVAIDQKIFVYGGLVIKDKTYRSDMWILDLSSMRWDEAAPKGKVPTPRIGHSVTLVRGVKILVHGGDAGPPTGLLQDVQVAYTDQEVQNLLVSEPSS